MAKVRNIETLQIGESCDWKFGFITRDVYRVDEIWFEITETSEGTITATVDLFTLRLVLDGKKCITELNWK